MVCHVFSAAIVNLCLQRSGLLIQLLYEQETSAQLCWQICNTYKTHIYARLLQQAFVTKQRLAANGHIPLQPVIERDALAVSGYGRVTNSLST